MAYTPGLFSCPRWSGCTVVAPTFKNLWYHLLLLKVRQIASYWTVGFGLFSRPLVGKCTAFGAPENGLCWGIPVSLVKVGQCICVGRDAKLGQLVTSS
jgi:hypothetical protein